VRLPTGNGRFREDPLLKVGTVLMTLALALVFVTVVAVYLRDEPEKAVASETAAESSVEPLIRSDPPGDPRVEKTPPQPEPEPEPPLEPESRPDRRQEPAEESLPVARTHWPMPTHAELEDANGTRRFRLPRGAIMSLTIDAIGIENAPVIDSASRSALDSGVIHEPETSLPWSRGAQRNVYLAGHRLGWAGTGSRLIFYHLDKLGEGDEISLRDRDGKKYRYRVSEVFEADPEDVWVMGQVVGRDMVTLQTCTPIPTFDKRLIVRADRI
jgi:sortase A